MTEAELLNAVLKGAAILVILYIVTTLWDVQQHQKLFDELEEKRKKSNEPR